MSYLRNRKTGIVLAGLCVAGVIHLLLKTFVSRDENPSSIPSPHSDTSFRSWTIAQETDKPDESFAVATRSNKKIIILSYMRSGSTLAGDIIQSHPDVFYVYEPLLYLWDYYVPNKMKVFQELRTRTKAYWKTDDASVSAQPLDFMTYMFNCNLTVYNLNFLTNTGHSQDFQTARCPVYKNDMNLVNTSDYCVNGVTKRCSEANAVLLKVVRLSMNEADKYLERNPDVKIIHLVRDPRGVLLSRMTFNDKETGEMHNNYTNICRRIFEDVKMSQTVSYKHRGKILTIRYEDLTQDLEGYTRRLFKFLDLSLDPNVLQHLQEITNPRDMPPNNDIVKGKKTTTRKNPYKTAYHWRSILPFSTVRKVDEACKELYEIMGYRHFITEADLRNENLSARAMYFGDGLLTASL